LSDSASPPWHDRDVDAGLLVIVALFVVFWLLLIRPQRRRQQAQEQMIANLRVGDEIVTAGGLYGDITAIEGDEVYVEIADGVEVRVARRAVAGVMPDEEEEPDEAEELPEEPEPAAERRSTASDES
jgi:preprotein translocase subunit YajC